MLKFLKKNKYVKFALYAIGILLLYKLLVRKKDTKPIITPNSNNTVNWTPIEPRPPFATPSAVPKNNALHWNNPTGIIKTSSVWTSYGEVQPPDNTSGFKAFKTLMHGQAAQLYLLLTYIRNGNDTVGGIVKTWTALKETDSYYNIYIRILGFLPSDRINTWKKLEKFASRQTYAETRANPADFVGFEFVKALAIVAENNVELYRYFNEIDTQNK
jgi:hypothetical protein